MPLPRRARPKLRHKMFLSSFSSPLGTSGGGARGAQLSDGSPVKVQPASQPGNKCRSLWPASLLPLPSSASFNPRDWRVDRMKIQSRTHPSCPRRTLPNASGSLFWKQGGGGGGNTTLATGTRRSQMSTRGFPGATMGENDYIFPRRLSFLFRWRG